MAAVGAEEIADQVVPLAARPGAHGAADVEAVLQGRALHGGQRTQHLFGTGQCGNAVQLEQHVALCARDLEWRSDRPAPLRDDDVRAQRARERQGDAALGGDPVVEDQGVRAGTRAGAGHAAGDADRGRVTGEGAEIALDVERERVGEREDHLGGGGTGGGLSELERVLDRPLPRVVDEHERLDLDAGKARGEADDGGALFDLVIGGDDAVGAGAEEAAGLQVLAQDGCQCFRVFHVGGREEHDEQIHGLAAELLSQASRQLGGGRRRVALRREGGRPAHAGAILRRHRLARTIREPLMKSGLSALSGFRAR